MTEWYKEEKRGNKLFVTAIQWERKSDKDSLQIRRKCSTKKSIINRNDSEKKTWKFMRKNVNCATWAKRKIWEKRENLGIQARKKVELDKVQTNYAAKRRFKSTRNDPINKTACLTVIGGKMLCVWVCVCVLFSLLRVFELLCVISNQRKQRDGTMITK